MLTMHGARLLLPPDARNRTYLHCHFEEAAARTVNGTGRGGAATPASVLSATLALCRSPTTSLPGAVSLSLRYASLLSDAAVVTFTYFALPANPSDANVSATSTDAVSVSEATTNHSNAFQVVVSSVYPHGGPSSGGTVVTVRGSGLVSRGGVDAVTGRLSQGVYCRFDPPADGDESTPQKASRAASALLKAEQRVESLKRAAFEAATTTSQLHSSLGNIASQPQHTLLVESQRSDIEKQLREALAEVDDLREDLNAMHVQGFDQDSGEANVAKLQGLVRASAVANRSSTSGPTARSANGNVSDGGYEGLVADAARSDEVTCVAPPLPSELADRALQTHATVRILVNGEMAALSTTSAPFRYYPDRRVRLVSLEPTGGPTAGGTQLTVNLRSPQALPPLLAEPPEADGAQVQCRFGGVSVPAQRMLGSDHPSTSSSRAQLAAATRDHAIVLSCVSPAVEALLRTGPHRIGRNDSGEVTVTVTLNGQDAIRRPALRWFYFPQHRVVISRLLPHGGPIAGGTRVRVLGSLFRQVSGARGMLCRFGPALPPVRATWVSIEEVQCVSPPLLNASGLNRSDDGNASALWVAAPAVCVSLNGDVDTCAGASAQAASPNSSSSTKSTAFQGSFHYYDPLSTAVISKIYPSAGPASGGTMVRIWGSSSAFRDLNSASGGSGLQCAFGDPPQLLLTPASFLQPSNDDLGSTALRNESSALQAAPIASTVAPSALLFCTTPASMRSVASETVPLRVVMNGEEGAAQLGVAAATDVRFAYYEL